MNTVFVIHLVSFFITASCRDFYIGMFRKNDYLVAQDFVYKERLPFRYTIAKYGRYFKCPITYFRVVDRLGTGPGPYTTIVRGGLQKNYIAVNIKSSYNQPISVNIYVGCENKTPVKIRRPTRATTVSKVTESAQNSTNAAETGNVTGATGADAVSGATGGEAGGGTTSADGAATTPAG